MTNIQAENPVRNVTEFGNLWNPPIRLKKTLRETLPLAIPRVELFQNITKNDMSTDIHGLVHNVDFELILATFCVSFRVSIRNLMYFR